MQVGCLHVKRAAPGGDGARPQPLDLKAMFRVFQSYITSLCQQPSLGHPDAFVATDS